MQETHRRWIECVLLSFEAERGIFPCSISFPNKWDIHMFKFIGMLNEIFMSRIKCWKLELNQVNIKKIWAEFRVWSVVRNAQKMVRMCSSFIEAKCGIFTCLISFPNKWDIQVESWSNLITKIRQKKWKLFSLTLDVVWKVEWFKYEKLRATGVPLGVLRVLAHV